ncbi:FprA family A-type flavoprotein [Anaerosacchariphilus polymeriproducens]|uniref:FprA family A-type flavoprotein n=1 Tax=Anaerosacchariphilus polymeriproducens TaxID=1812858 RepID=A0A371ARF6_9FIRM|nr:FprA family A-type flavoprotein [Anaerosacchariphilus polymeriproducens]RDU22156.1 FprA family A-type flavoprotein [Anaerosacchariphilus polymeriproducens]
MNIVQVKDGIYAVGAVDWNVRSFHGYSTNRGSSYNAYLIMDEKITLLDTVKEPFSQELIDRISEIVDPAKIDYLVSNHVEMDHSGGIPELMKVAENATIITSSPSGLKGLQAHYGKNYKYQEVKAGDELSIGKRTLTFVSTPMLHWPDNMVTYCKEEKILFSNDAFGQHLASSKYFDDEVDFEVVLQEAIKYYANILMLYGAQTRKALEIVKGLDIDMIAPSHGIIYRSHVEDIIKAYEYYSNEIPDEKAIVVYDSMWHSTEKMAKAIFEGFAKKGIPAKFYDLKENHISDIMTEILKAKYIAVGSPTLNNNMLPTVSAFLTYMKGLAPKNKKAFAFGSHGWGGQGSTLVNDELTACKFEIVLDPIKIAYVPTKEQLVEIENKIAQL